MTRVVASAITVLLIIAATTPSGFLHADEPPVITVPAGPALLQLAVPLPEGAKLPQGDVWQLVEVDQPSVVVPAQLIPAIAPDGTAAKDARRLVADVPARKSISGPRRFRLQAGKQRAGAGFRFEDLDDKSLKLLEGEAPVMVYNHGMITNESVPQKDHRRSRACYIHPVWGLNGEVLTDDFPRDHYHHHGIFWTWPHVGVGGKGHDLWAGNTIKDRFVGWICRQAGPLAAVLAVENGWFVGEKKVMIERVWMRTYRASNDTRAIDIEFVWIPTDAPVSLRGAGGKSYGGLTLRLNVPRGEDGIVTVPGRRITHSGEDLYNTKLPWADITTVVPGCPVRSGAAVFVHPQHPDYPPTWLTRCYGPLCVGWPGVNTKTFEPGVPFRAGYRILLHKTELSIEQLQQLYEGYTQAARATCQ